jgi:hypothetical protein
MMKTMKAKMQGLLMSIHCRRWVRWKLLLLLDLHIVMERARSFDVEMIVGVVGMVVAEEDMVPGSRRLSRAKNKVLSWQRPPVREEAEGSGHPPSSMTSLPASYRVRSPKATKADPGPTPATQYATRWKR